jgi:hypothetical protein
MLKYIYLVCIPYTFGYFNSQPQTQVKEQHIRPTCFMSCEMKTANTKIVLLLLPDNQSHDPWYLLSWGLYYLKSPEDSVRFEPLPMTIIPLGNVPAESSDPFIISIRSYRCARLLETDRSRGYHVERPHLFLDKIQAVNTQTQLDWPISIFTPLVENNKHYHGAYYRPIAGERASRVFYPCTIMNLLTRRDEGAVDHLFFERWRIGLHPSVPFQPRLSKDSKYILNMSSFFRNR